MSNIVVCTDLIRGNIYGSFLETLNHISRDSKQDTYALIIAGNAHEPEIDKLKKIITEKIKLHQEKIIIIKESTASLCFKENPEYKSILASIKNARDINELAKIKYKENMIGISISSSLASRLNCINIDLDQHRDLVESYYFYAVFFFESFNIFLKSQKNKENTYFIFNGRFYNNHPLTSHDIKINYYELCHYTRKLIVSSNRIHDFKNISIAVKKFWEGSLSSNRLKKKIGKIFFEKNKKNKFTTGFKDSGSLSELIRKHSKNKIISYFTSTDHEFSFLDPSINIGNLFKSQQDTIKYLCSWVKKNPGYSLIIRQHPNSRNCCHADNQFFKRLENESVDVIPFSSEIDTYSLINKSDLVISFLSTTSIEATLSGKPSISIAYAPYSGLNCVYEPASEEELTVLLKSDIPAKNKENCYIYGYYMMKSRYKITLSDKIGINLFSFERDSCLTINQS